MSMAFSPESFANVLVEARRTRRRLPAEMPGPEDAASAFAVQDRVAAAFGPVGGWKVGRAGADAPVTAAPLFASLVRTSPCAWPAAEFGLIGIEVEIAVRLGRSLDTPTPDPDEVRAAIGSVHAAIEIVDTRFDAWPVPDRLAALADNQSNGGFVYDPAGVPYRGQDLAVAEISLEVDGRVEMAGSRSNPAGDVIATLSWLVGHLATRQGGVAAGTLVTLGSFNGILFVEPGASVEAAIEGVGRVAVAFPR